MGGPVRTPRRNVGRDVVGADEAQSGGLSAQRLVRVSVVIPTWNAGEVVSEAIESVVSQGREDVEIIIVDDGSTDQTADIVLGWTERADTAVRYAHLDHTGGPAGPRNVGIRQAVGHFVALLDADDFMEPNKLEMQLRVFDENPEVGVCFTDFGIVDYGGRVLRARALDEYNDFRQYLLPGRSSTGARVGLLRGVDLYYALVRANFIGTSSVVARASLLRQDGGFDETLSNADDIDLWLRLARSGVAFAFLDMVGHQYRQTGVGVSGRGWRRLVNVLKVLRRQSPFVRDAATRKSLENSIQGCMEGIAWGLRREGRHAEAVAAYREAVSVRRTWGGVRGLWLSRLCKMAGVWRG